MIEVHLRYRTLSEPPVMTQSQPQTHPFMATAPFRHRILVVDERDTTSAPFIAAIIRQRLHTLGIRGVSVESAGVAAVPGHTAHPCMVAIARDLGMKDLEEHLSRPLPLNIHLTYDTVVVTAMVERYSTGLVLLPWKMFMCLGHTRPWLFPRTFSDRRDFETFVDMALAYVPSYIDVNLPGRIQRIEWEKIMMTTAG